MDSSAHPGRRRGRAQLVGLLALALTAALPAAPAWAEAPPVLSGLTATVGDRAALLSWTAGGSGTAVACVIPAPAETVTQADCTRTLPVSGLSARDPGFTNTASVTYAVWAVDADGTASDAPAQVTLAPAPAVPTSVVLSPASTVVPYGRGVTLTGVLTRSGNRVPAQSVQLWAGVVGSGTSTLIRHLQTGSDGVVRYAVTPRRSTRFQLRFAGNAFSQPSASPGAVVTVVPRVTLNLTTSVVGSGQTAYAFGQAVPVVGGSAVVVQRQVSGVWRNYLQTRQSSSGTYRVAVRPGVGTHALRVITGPVLGLRRATSRVLTLTVYPRDLYDGMAGVDVLSLQRFLASRRYDPGPLNGSYGYDTVHAVMAFQKLERLPITGRWGRLERARAARPTAFRLRYPMAARSVEIDLTRQIMVLSEGGRVLRILDVSSGNDKPYTVDGVTYRAFTPRGRFSIYRKINGLRVSRLGGLWKPSYFYGGWAIHGSASVPSYPASHGCVRITNPAADRIFPLLTIGTRVAVYDS